MFDRLSRRAPWRCVIAVVASLAVLQPAQAADEFAVTPAQMQSLGVQLQRLAPGAGTEGPTYPARVVLPPRQEQVISAPLAGVIDQLLVMENDAVRAGQPLARLASPELGELQLRLMEAASQNRLAARTLQRERQLFAEGIIAQRRVQEAEAAAAQHQARQRQGEAALRLAGLDNATIRRVANGATVDSVLILRARTSGLVSHLDVKPGQRVQPADALVRIADTSRLWLDVQVPVGWQGGAASVKGLPMTVVGREIVAAGQSLGATVSDSQTLTLRAEVKRGAQLLRPGEFVQVRLPLAAAPGWNVPLASVVRQDGKAFVFVRTPKGFIAKPVTVLASAGQTVRVAGDLQAGQEIAATAVIALKSAWQGKGGSN
ncbi:MAG: efflux RND transporter periplasmic adaptor subunit [Ramlibacter sp.]